MTEFSPDYLWNSPNDPRDDSPLVVLAHGAGAAMDTPFMTTVAEGLTRIGPAVVRFEFPYMQQRRATGSRRPPDRAPVLLDAWRHVVADLRTRYPARPLIIGGKSMGGRMASMVADELAVAGLICLGYPFHPPRRPEKTRTEHLGALAAPTLIVQGTRDPFGQPHEVEAYALSQAIRLVWLADGDHSFKPRKASGHTEAGHLDACIAAMATFVSGLSGRTPARTRSPT